MLGLVNKYFVKPIISGSIILPKYLIPIFRKEGYERLGSFRSRFFCIFVLLASIAAIGILLYDLILLKPFVANFSDISFYFKLLGFIVGIYYGAKIIPGTLKEQREKIGIKDEDIR